MGTATKYRYRNANNGEIVEFDETNERLERLDNWSRVGENDGDGEVEVGEEEVTTDDVVETVTGNLPEFDDDQIRTLYNAVGGEAFTRNLTGADAGGSAETGEGIKETGSTSTDDIEATDAAKELAEAEDIDLSKVKATGKDGSITVGDVRKVVEANEKQ